MLKNIRKLREANGMEQKPFAAQFGIKPTTYSSYEAANVEPKFSFLKAVADKYRVTLDYLMDFCDDPHKAKYGGRSELEEKYLALDETSRKVVDAVMEIEAERAAIPENERKKIPLDESDVLLGGQDQPTEPPSC